MIGKMGKNAVIWDGVDWRFHAGERFLGIDFCRFGRVREKLKIVWGG